MGAVEQTAGPQPASTAGPTASSSRIRRAPLAVFWAGLLLIATGAGLVAAHVTVFALDETMIQQSAVHYTHDFPHSLFHDLDARATDRLYSLLLSIALRVFNGYSAIRIDHVLSVILFVSAAIPIYLMARAILRAPWMAVAAALLSVAVPWLTLTSALYTENLSYPLFWWMMLAACRVAWRPSIGRDAITLLSIVLLVCTRVQFAAVFPGYLIGLFVVQLVRSPAGANFPRRTASALGRAVRSAPLSFAVLAASVVGFIYEITSTNFQLEVEKLLGSYSNVVIRNGVSSNMVEGLLIELIALALGVGLLPAIVSLVWYAKRIARPEPGREWTFLCMSGVVLVCFLILTVFSQGGYLGSGTEERYFFYVIPVFWLGTFAALREGGVRPGELLACAVGMAALYGTIPLVSPLTQETAFLAPAESIVPHVLIQRFNQLGLTGVTVQDALALLTVAVGVFVAYAWRRRALVRTWCIAGVAVALQLVMTGYAFAVITGHVSGIAGRTGGTVPPLGWVDTHAHSQNVAWLDNLLLSAPPTSNASAAEDQQRATLFWNSRLTTWTTIPALGLPPVNFPMSALPGLYLELSPHTGAVIPAAAAASMSEVVSATESPFLQLAGNELANSPDSVLSLVGLDKPVHATWLALGLQGEGAVLSGAPVRLYAYPEHPGSPTVLHIRFTLSPVAAPDVSTSLTWRLGGAVKKIRLKGGGSARSIEISTCLPAAQHVLQGTLRATHSTSLQGRSIAGTLEGVRVASVTTASSRCVH